MFRFSDRENYAGLQLLKLICFDFQGGKFKLYLIPGSSVFTFDLRKLAHQISNVIMAGCCKNSLPGTFLIIITKSDVETTLGINMNYSPSMKLIL